MNGYNRTVRSIGPEEIAEARRRLGVFRSQDTIADGDVVYVNASGYIARAQANASSTMHAIGVADQAIASGLQGAVVFAGHKYSSNYNFSGSIGRNAYVSAATAGAILGTKPTSSGWIVQQIAIITGYQTMQVSIGGAYQVGVVANFV